MKVYEVSPLASLKCQDKDQEFLNPHKFSGVPFPDKWKRVELLLIGAARKQLDFYGFEEKALVCSEQVRLFIGPFEDEGEFFPVRIKGVNQRYYLYNLTHCASHLNARKTIWNPTVPRGQSGSIKTPAFHADRLGEDCVFKIPEDGATAIYCLERTDVPGHEGLKTLVKIQELTGLKFEPVWSDSAPKIVNCRKR